MSYSLKSIRKKFAEHEKDTEYVASLDEVYIDIDGVLYEIDFGHEEDKFDGFYT